MALATADVMLLLLAAVLVVLNGFFVGAEFAIVKLRRTQVEAMERAGDRHAKIAKNVLDHLDSYLGAIQLGITAASLGLGWVGEPAIAHLIEPWLVSAGIESETVLHAVSFTIAFSIITFAHVVLGELAPKSLAIRHPVETTKAIARPLVLFYFLSWPFMKVFNGAALWLLRLVGIDPVTPTETLHSEEELESIVSSIEEGQVRSPLTREVLTNVFWLRRLMVRQVMTHRTRVVALDVQAPFEENIKKARESGFVRFPVVDGTMDKVVGVVHLKDIAWREQGESSKFLLNVARPPVVIPETATLDTALHTLLEAKAKMGIIADEHGGTEGLVTSEDLLEELVGEMEDAFNPDEQPTHVALPNGRLLLRGDAPLHDLEEVLQLSSNDPDVSTVSGFLVAELGRVPRRGESIVAQGWRLTAMDVSGRTIVQVVAEHIVPDEDVDALAEEEWE